MRVFVLLFNARTENEGIHTIQQGDLQKVLAFESEDDATRFALMLEAQDFPTPTVEPMELEEIKLFCEKAGYDVDLIETGRLELPPDNNLEETDWNPNAPSDSEVEETESETEAQDFDAIRRNLEKLL